MKPCFSESSYGQQITSELEFRHSAHITTYPVLPSRQEEAVVGYDAKLEFGDILLFLQFKLSHHMVGTKAREASSKEINVKYYRMNLSPKLQYNQHEILRKLEKKTCHNVSYVAPEFHTKSDFKKFYIGKEVCKHSRWIKPSEIGRLSGEPNHCVAFEPDGDLYVFSKPRRLDNKGTFEEFEKSLVDSLENQPQDKPQSDTPEKALEETASYISNMIEISNIMGKRVRSSNFKLMGFLHEKLAELHPLYRIAFYSHFFLDSRLFIVKKKTD